MKKSFGRLAVVLSLLFGCGTSASAQGILEGLLSTMKEKSAKSDSSSSATKNSVVSDLYTGLSSIFQNSKVATKDKIVGTWVYEEPAIVFESSNVLKQAGGKLASAAIEKKLEATFSKYGIKKGNMTMTFDKNGNFTQTLLKKKIKGTYTIDGKNVKLTYAGGIKQMVGTTQIDGNSLLIVMDASKLIKFASVLGTLSKNSVLTGASSLLSSMDGMECGVRLVKK